MGYQQHELFPDVATPLEADRTSAERRRKIILHEAAGISELAGRKNDTIGQAESAVMLAVLAAVDHGWSAALPRDRGEPVDLVNQYLESNNPGIVGTSVEDLSVPGDYDFALVILIRIALQYSRYLTSAVRMRLFDVLLNERGPFRREQLTKTINIQVGLLESGAFSIPETENHITGIEVSRYLTNQLLGADNSALGVTDFLISWLQEFLRNDFLEYNARGYQNYTVRSITVLHDLAADSRVRDCARLVLDYLTAKFAISSNGLRRHVPFRRLAENTNVDPLFDAKADPESPRWLALTGLRRLYTAGDPELKSLAIEISVPAVLSVYRPPLAMINLMMNNYGKHYYQRFRHAGVEIFSSTPDFLISAGGIWMEGPYHLPVIAGVINVDLSRLSSKDVSIPLPTVLMPSEEGVAVTQLVRIEGNIFGDDRARINTGVAPGFACGLRIMVPEHLRQATDIRVHHDRLTLVNCTTLPNPEHHYLAIRTDGAIYSPSSGDLMANVGWIVAVSADALTFDEFEHSILAGGGEVYVTLKGLHHLVPTPWPPVSFTPYGEPGNKYLWPIRGAQGEWIDARSWPLASGDVMNSEGHTGVVHIDHPLFRVLGPAGLAAKRISAAMSLRTEMGRRSVSLAGGVRASVRHITGLPPEALVSLRAAVSLLRRRLTLDGPRLRRIAPRYTAREVALLYEANPNRGLRQLFAYQRGLAEIRLSELVAHPGGRYTVRAACGVLRANPALGLRRLFPAQAAQRVREYRLSTLTVPN